MDFSAEEGTETSAFLLCTCPAREHDKHFPKVIESIRILECAVILLKILSFDLVILPPQYLPKQRFSAVFSVKTSINRQFPVTI